MDINIYKYLNKVHDTLKEMQKYQHAASVLNFDLETVCPPEAKEEQGDTISFLSNLAYKIRKSEDFIDACEKAYEHINDIDNEYDKMLIEDLHEDFLRCKKITPEIQREFSDIYQAAFIAWEKAKHQKDYSLFKSHLEKIKETTIKELELSKLEDDDFATNYDVIFNDYEEGMTSEDLDRIFGELRPALVELLNKIKNSKKTIRTDFLSRTVSDAQQKEIGRLMLNTIGFDWSRGTMTTSEHPFTDKLAKNDSRITTHFYPNAFNYSMYSCLHEGGHAIFEQNGNKEAIDHFYDNKSMAQHESVSRLYENLFGSSKEFIYAIFDDLKKIIPNVLSDVTPQELYEALNVVEPTLIRTEADELTYSLHIIIRYEIEKMIVNDDNFDFAKLPEIWNSKYKEYLGIEPANDAEGVLQDVHWSGGFGYFPTYALGNIYNAMYYETMSKDIDIKGDLAKKDFSNINKWMIENVFADADKLDAGEWIKQITGKELTAKPFIDYLNKKYSEIYQF